MFSKKDITEFEKIIKNSGNTFHSRVVRLLRTNGWEVLVSPFYSDNFTDKPREIDIIAEKSFNVRGDLGRNLGRVNARLFIECKYINDNIAFWFDMKDKERAIKRIMADTGMQHPNDTANIQKLHYFLDEPVAKIFASSKHLGNEYDIIYKAINQNLNSLIYYRNEHDSLISGIKKTVLKIIPFPIIVCNSFDKMCRVDMLDDTNVVEEVAKPFQLEVNYAHVGKDRNEYFLIDVVTVENLPLLLSIFEKDVDVVIDKILWDKRVAGTI